MREREEGGESQKIQLGTNTLEEWKRWFIEQEANRAVNQRSVSLPKGRQLRQVQFAGVSP